MDPDRPDSTWRKLLSVLKKVATKGRDIANKTWVGKSKSLDDHDVVFYKTRNLLVRALY